MTIDSAGVVSAPVIVPLSYGTTIARILRTVVASNKLYLFFSPWDGTSTTDVDLPYITLSTSGTWSSISRVPSVRVKDAPPLDETWDVALGDLKPWVFSSEGGSMHYHVLSGGVWTSHAVTEPTEIGTQVVGSNDEPVSADYSTNYGRVYVLESRDPDTFGSAWGPAGNVPSGWTRSQKLIDSPFFTGPKYRIVASLGDSSVYLVSQSRTGNLAQEVYYRRKVGY